MDISLEVMESTVLPWIKTVAGDRHWVWPQDSAPHTTKASLITSIKENFAFMDKAMVAKDCMAF
jgi:hypothetical protein